VLAVPVAGHSLKLFSLSAFKTAIRPIRHIDELALLQNRTEYPYTLYNFFSAGFAPSNRLLPHQPFVHYQQGAD
jgi:hypothetical protein